MDMSGMDMSWKKQQPGGKDMIVIEHTCSKRTRHGFFTCESKKASIADISVYMMGFSRDLLTFRYGLCVMFRFRDAMRVR